MLHLFQVQCFFFTRKFRDGALGDFCALPRKNLYLLQLIPYYAVIQRSLGGRTKPVTTFGLSSFGVGVVANLSVFVCLMGLGVNVNYPIHLTARLIFIFVSIKFNLYSSQYK